MAASTTVTIRNLTTGAGVTGLTVTLRGPADNYTANLYTATPVAGKDGVYEFLNVIFGKYKLFVNGTEDNTFGGAEGRYFPVSDLRDVALCFESAGDHYDALSKRIKNVAAPESHTDAVNRIYLTGNFYTQSQTNEIFVSYSYLSANHYTKTESNAKFFDKDGNQAITGNNIYSGVMAITGQLLCGAASTVQFTATEGSYPRLNDYMIPPGNNHFAPKKFVTDAIANAIANIAGGYVESPNVIWLAPDIGVALDESPEETNYIAPTFGGANTLVHAKGASASNRVTVLIKGMGTDNSNGYLIVEPGGHEGATDNFEKHASFVGLNQGIRLYVPDDGFDAVAAGNVRIENLTLMRLGDDSSPQFTNFVFRDCIFEMSDNNINFVNCIFLGTCIIKTAAGVITLNNCKGSRVSVPKEPVITGTNKIDFEMINF